MVEARERSLKYSCGLMLLKSVTKHSRNFDSVAVEVVKCFLCFCLVKLFVAFGNEHFRTVFVVFLLFSWCLSQTYLWIALGRINNSSLFVEYPSILSVLTLPRKSFPSNFPRL
jgi:hypothetical protein